MSSDRAEYMLHIASIVHLTDLHLFIHANGTERPPSDRTLVARLTRAVLERTISGLASGLATADSTVFQELCEFLPEIVEAECSQDAKVVILQTGDVDAFGSVPPDGLAGYTFLHSQLWPRLQGLGATCIDVYGNHDIWSGHPPLPLGSHDVKHLMDLPAFNSDWAVPIPVHCHGGVTLHFHRVNTVIRNRFRGGILARGGVSPHPPPRSVSQEDIPKVLASVRECPGDESAPTFEILVCHNPPHLFSPGIGTEFTTGYFYGHREAGELTPDPITLVIAGHRHLLNPAEPISANDGTQAPLRAGAGQLVAASPTQRDGNPNSLSVYRLYCDDAHSMLHVDRLNFKTGWETGISSIPTIERGIISDLRVQRTRGSSAV